jgi:hypothetical protein
MTLTCIARLRARMYASTYASHCSLAGRLADRSSTRRDPADCVRTERQRPCMVDGADLSTDVLILIMQRAPSNARRQFRLVRPALLAARRHAHLHQPSQPRRDARRHQEASAASTSSTTTTYHLQLRQSDAAGRCPKYQMQLARLLSYVF